MTADSFIGPHRGGGAGKHEVAFQEMAEAAAGQSERHCSERHRINSGQMPDLSAPRDATDFYFIEDPGRILPSRGSSSSSRNASPPLRLDPMCDIQVLCPMNRGALGARSLNIELQRALNPRGEPKVEKFGMAFAIGYAVMQTMTKRSMMATSATSKPSISNSAR
jgi:ATP-dependent exoDNAse (exonuclease V) alpha subunit